MVMQPVGPLPASTYWRRRAVLLVIVLVVLFVAKSCVGGGGQKPTAAAKPKVTASPSATPTTRATVTPTVKTTATPTVSKAATGTCTDAVLKLTGSTDQDAYTVGESPRLTIKVTNTGATPCVRDLGQGAVEVLIYSGASRQWSSDDCNPSKATALTTLPAGGAQSVVVSWSGHRSQPGCSGTKAQAAPGTYLLQGRIGTLKGTVAHFQFHT